MQSTRARGVRLARAAEIPAEALQSELPEHGTSKQRRREARKKKEVHERERRRRAAQSREAKADRRPREAGNKTGAGWAEEPGANEEKEWTRTETPALPADPGDTRARRADTIYGWTAEQPTEGTSFLPPSSHRNSSKIEKCNFPPRPASGLHWGTCAPRAPPPPPPPPPPLPAAAPPPTNPRREELGLGHATAALRLERSPGSGKAASRSSEEREENASRAAWPPPRRLPSSLRAFPTL
eukprot:COSAG04_NODE_945_length_9228_cov_3.344726_7_plen_240_part_00